MTYPLTNSNIGRPSSLYGAIAKLVEAGINFSPRVSASMYPGQAARYAGGSPVAFYYFMAPDDDPDVPESVRAEGYRRNVAHWCPDTGSMVIEPGPDGLGRRCGIGFDHSLDVGQQLLPMLVKTPDGERLYRAAVEQAIDVSTRHDKVFNIWLGYRLGRLCVYVTPDAEQPGPSDCKHVLSRSYSRGQHLID